MIPEKVLQELEKEGHKRVLVQLPEGLKVKATEITRDLEQAGFEPIISGDLCFGACDLKFLEGATTLHVGHCRMIGLANTVYWEYPYEHKLIPAVEKALPLLGDAVGLFTTVQHLGEIEEAKDFLEQKGKKVFTAPGRTTHYYQVLGCDVDGPLNVKEDVDSFLYIGGGRFHPIGIAYYTKRPVIAVDPFSLEVQEVDSAVWEKERALRQTKAMNAQSFGIIVSSKPGQTDWKSAEETKKKLEADGKRALVIYLENASPDSLLPYDVDAFVITGCPRIVVDDWKSYKKAILLPDEIVI